MGETEGKPLQPASGSATEIDELVIDFSKFDDEDLAELGALARQNGAGVGSYSLARSSKAAGHATGIEGLVSEIPDQKQILLAVVDLCREPKDAQEIDAVVCEYSQYRKSVYTPQIVRSILTRAGALSPVGTRPNPEDCDDYVFVEEPADGCGPLSYRESDLVYDENGALVIPEEESECRWVATEEALVYLEKDDPAKELDILLERHPKYREIYENILLFCEEGDRTTTELDRFVEDDPRFQELLEHPKLFAGHFVGKLEQFGMLEWRGVWHLSEMGRRYLAR